MLGGECDADGWAWLSRLALVHTREMHAFFRIPLPPNFGLSRHSLQWPQSGARHASHAPQRLVRGAVRWA